MSRLSQMSHRFWILTAALCSMEVIFLYIDLLFIILFTIVIRKWSFDFTHTVAWTWQALLTRHSFPVLFTWPSNTQVSHMVMGFSLSCTVQSFPCFNTSTLDQEALSVSRLVKSAVLGTLGRVGGGVRAGNLGSVLYRESRMFYWSLIAMHWY